MSDVTRILSEIESGDPQAAEQLLPLVYAELRMLAAQRLVSEKPGQTLQATALVHEAYLRLVGSAGHELGGQHFNGRGHFFAAAAEAMRRILVDSARRRNSLKRGSGQRRIPLPEAIAAVDGASFDLLALDEALQRLAGQHPDKARLVELRYFAGCSLEETAEILGISRATAQRSWAFARAWLYGQLNQD